MKILWFTGTPSLYNKNHHHYHGGGWIESLEDIINKETTINLGISFFHKTDSLKRIKDNTTYYPMLRVSQRKEPLKNIYNNWKGSLNDSINKKNILNIIEDFKPDVIHVFGSENGFGEIKKYTNIPVVIHLQGLMNPYLNSYFPPLISNWSFLISSKYLLKNIIGGSPFFSYKRFKKQAKRESNVLKKISYVMGRTAWDKSIAEFYNEDTCYFHVNEVLRPIFYENNHIIGEKKPKLIIISTLSPTVYKGIDVVLKTAQLLKGKLNIDFEWLLIGLEEDDKLFKFFEKKININHKAVNVKCLGRQKPDKLVSLITNSDIFVHPSYIDNSPNSVCEAQILGVPVIACNVGGVSSIVKNNETGFLVPSNGVFEIAYIINQISKNNIDHIKIAENAKVCATKRHDRMTILSDLILAYKAILQ